MFNKKISSTDMNVVKNAQKTFSKGIKFSFNGKTGIVTEVKYSDNTDFRRVVYDDGTVEDLMLTTLITDSQSNSFVFLALDDDEEEQEEQEEQDGN